MVMDVGPFRFYRVQEGGTLCVSIKWLDNLPFGWEYSWADVARGEEHPWINLRIGKLNIFSFEAWRWGLEFWFLGFWIIL